MRETRCDCWQHEHQVCNICQGVTDAPQVERFMPAVRKHPFWDAVPRGVMTRCAEGEYARYADYVTLEAERDRARSAYRDQHAKTLFEHARAERAEAENKELRAWQSGLQSDFVAVVKQAEAVESSLASLREAVREWKDAKRESDDNALGWTQRVCDAEIALRALVLTPQGEK